MGKKDLHLDGSLWPLLSSDCHVWIFTTAPSYHRPAIERLELADVGTSPSVASG